jgi:hypothetical protein
MLQSTLLALALVLSNGELPKRAALVVDDVISVESTVDPVEFYPELAKEPELAREKLGRLLVSWSFWESTWNHKAIGDGGRSCGIMQVMARTHNRTCSELTASRKAGLTAGLQEMKYLVGKCGNIKSAMGAYISGKCGALPKLIEKRCKISGGC